MLKKWGFFPLFHRLLTQGRGFTVTDSDPELTSPCVATETEELRKREEAGQWGVTTLRSEGREKRSLFFFMYNCFCLRLSCCRLSSRRRPIWHTDTHIQVWSQHYSLLLIWQSTGSSTSYKEIFLPTQLASSKMAGGSFGLVAHFETLHN